MKAGGEGLSARGAPRPWWGERTNIFASSALAGRRRRSAPSPGQRGRRVTGSPGVFSAPAGREGPLRSAPRRAPAPGWLPRVGVGPGRAAAGAAGAAGGRDAEEPGCRQGVLSRCLHAPIVVYRIKLSV